MTASPTAATYLQLGHDLPSFTPDAIPPPPHTTNTVRYDEYTRAP